MDPNNPKPGEGGENTDDTSAIDAALGADAGAGDVGEDAIAAIDSAIEATPAGADPDDDDGADGAGTVASAGEGEGAATGDAAASDAAAAKKDGEGASDAGKDGKPEAGKDGKENAEPHADDVAEAAALNLKGKSNERFVAMAGEIRAFAPIKAALEQAGIKDAAALPAVLQRARDADGIVGMVMDTGASAEQYEQTLDFLTVLNKGMAGDRAAAEKAFEMVGAEYAAMARALGKEVPGVFDPLAEHKDLQDEIKAGDITRERALEIAAARRLTAARQQADSSNAQADAHERATAQGRDALATWDQSMRADPAYLAKRPILDKLVANIRRTLPPAQWLQATQEAYAAIPNLPAAQAPSPPPAKPAPSAMRPAGAQRALQPEAFDDPIEAIDSVIGG